MAVDYIEQARLILKADQAKREARAVNRDLKAILATVQKLNRTNVRMKISVSNPSTIKKELARLSKTRDVRLRAKISNPIGIKNQIAQLTKTRDLLIKPRLAQKVLPNPTVTPNNNGRPPVGPNTVGQGIRDALRPRQIGRDMARSFTISVGHEMFQIARQITRVVANSPVALDDAIARVRIAGRTDDEVKIIREIAERASAKFQGVTEAQIIANSGEVTGRFGDLTIAENFEKAERAMFRLARNTQIIDQALPNGGTGGADNQARLVETAIQMLGATDNEKRAEEISTAALQGIIASGGDLTASDIKRMLQQVPTGRSAISDDTLLQLMLARDEQGRRGTGNFDQMLSDLVRGNLNEKDMAAQLSAEERFGISVRNKDGSSDLFDALANDFLGTVETQIRPLLEKQGIDTTDRENAGLIRSFLDNQLGFSKQGGITTLTDAILNLPESLREFTRARKGRPEVGIEDPTLRLELKAVRAQFENVAASSLEPLIPAVKSSLDTISDTLNDVQKGETTVTGAALTVGAAAIPLALGAAMQGMMDPSTRATSASALALTGSATALSGSAAALTAAAVAQTAAGIGGPQKGRIAKALAFIGTTVKRLGPIGLLLAANSGARVSDEVQRGNHPGMGMNLDNLPPSERQKFEPKTTEELREIAKALEKVATDTRQRNDAAAELAVMSQFVAPKFDPTTAVAARAIPPQEITRIVDILDQANARRQESQFPNTGPAGQGEPVLTLEPDLPSEMAMTMIAGKGGLDASIADMAETLGAFGPAASEQLVAGAEQFGQRAGAAFSQTVGAIDVNVPSRPNASTKPALATGKTKLE